MFKQTSGSKWDPSTQFINHQHRVYGRFDITSNVVNRALDSDQKLWLKEKQKCRK